MLRAAKFGKIKVYQDFQSRPFTHREIDSIIYPYRLWNDSELEDPVTGLYVMPNEILKERNFEANHKYSVQESWSYDSVAGKIDIKIKGFSPLMERFSDEGFTMGYLPVCVFKYDRNTRKCIHDYEQTHPKFNLNTVIWNSLFFEKNTSDLFRQKKIVTKFFNRIVSYDCVALPMDSLKHSFVKDLFANRLTMYHWSDSLFQHPLTEQYYFEMIFANENERKNELRNLYFNTNEIDKFKVLEKWQFDQDEGKMSMQIIAIMPMARKSVYFDNGSRDLVWFKYDDVKELMWQYRNYYPDDNLLQRLLNGYLTDLQ